MARLTWEYIHGGMFVDSEEVEQCELDDIDVHTGPAIIKLAEYEDTGLTPEEVKNLAITWQGKELNDHITELLTAEKQGLLIKIPCKEGDTVYYILGIPNKTPCAIEETTFGLCDLKRIGKDLFLTREEAEKHFKSLSTTETVPDKN